jgi:hypothetical protein
MMIRAAVEQSLRNAHDLRLWEAFKTIGITAVEAVVRAVGCR